MGRGRPPHILRSLKIQQLLGRMVSRDICAVSVVEECTRCANAIACNHGQVQVACGKIKKLLQSLELLELLEFH
jgi:hypothetical protein